MNSGANRLLFRQHRYGRLACSPPSQNKMQAAQEIGRTTYPTPSRPSRPKGESRWTGAGETRWRSRWMPYPILCYPVLYGSLSERAHCAGARFCKKPEAPWSVWPQRSDHGRTSVGSRSDQRSDQRSYHGFCNTFCVCIGFLQKK